jgi:hypothetical protein
VASESLTDRQFEAFRRVQPGRKVKNRKSPETTHSEEYAIAVVDTEGQPVAVDAGQLLRQLVLLQSETNLMLSIIASQLGAVLSPDMLPQTMAGTMPGMLVAI